MSVADYAVVEYIFVETGPFTQTVTGTGIASAEAFGTHTIRDITPPGITVVDVSLSKISRVAGKDSTQITVTANEPFVQVQIRRVSSPTDTVNMGTSVVNLLLV